MRIVIDHVLDDRTKTKIGEMVVHTEHLASDEHRRVAGLPVGATILDFLAWLDKNEDAKTAAGYHHQHQIPDDHDNLTLWHRVVSHCRAQHPDTPEFKAGLSYDPRKKES